MTPQEAIEWLLGIENKYIHGGDEWFDENRKQAIKTAISALEKQIPKKLRVDDEGWLCCPKCDETFKLHNQYHEKNRYCGNCGQKICWGDSE